MVGVGGLNLFFAIPIFVLGACFGSFFNVLIDRLPKHQSIVLPASHCASCGTPLPFYLNIPIVSYLVLGGKCKFCGAKIHIHHLLVEILTPVIYLALFWKFGTDPTLFAKYLVLFSFLIPIFFIDLYNRLILDKMTIPMAILGLGFGLLPGNDISFWNALLTAVILLLLMLGIVWLFEKVRHKEGMGGGDLKLLAALATYLGAINIAFVLFFASILAIIGAVFSKRGRQEGIAFGPFLAVACLIWVLAGGYILQWYVNIL